MQRRQFLGLTAGVAGGGAAWAAGGGWAASGAYEPAAAALVVTGIGPTTDAANLTAFLEAAIAGGLWVTCAVRPPGDALDGYDGLLAALLSMGAGVELALDLPELSGLSPYFQARAIYEARGRLSARLAGLVGVSGAEGAEGAEGAALPAIRSVVTAPARNPTAPEGLRAAGIRNLLVRPRASGPTRTEAWPGGVVRLYGGTHLGLLTPRLPALEGRATKRLFYIAADALTGEAEAVYGRWGRRLAEAFFEAELDGAMTAMPVSELQLRDDYGFARQVVVRLIGVAGELADALSSRGIPVWQVDAPAPGYWVGAPGGPDAPSTAQPPIALDRLTCGADGRLIVEAGEALPGGTAVRLIAETARPGLDGCAALGLRERAVTGPMLLGDNLLAPGDQDDLVLTLHPEALATPQDRRALLAALDALRGDAVTRFTTLPALVNGALSHTPVDQRFRETRPAALAKTPARAPLTAAETARFLDDARRAWAFFERFTDPVTGLCPATANVFTGEDAITWVTMWDVGSQINALIAAQRLGLIDASAREAAARRILAQIAGARSGGRLLPNGVIRTDKPRSGSRDFDGCDAGRLLSALDSLRRRSTLGDEVAALVASWDLDAVIVEGEIQSVTAGVMSSTYTSHCAHYAARAFDRWGLAAASPYRTFESRSEADGQMALLERIAGIGPLGAEPLLLEALELGMSRESAWLAEVLDVAQREEYAETGRLMAVSEMPIRRPPWFAYLGLQLGRDRREWGIDVVGGAAEYRTEAFLEQNMALSTKAAFLWAAYRPGAYADALLAEIRARAELPVGFASSVAPGGEVAPFTDLNTNAVILQAIAEILGDRPPAP